MTWKIVAIAVTLAAAATARAQVVKAPLANGSNASVGNSSPAAATEAWPHLRRAAPLANGSNATVGNSSPTAATERWVSPRDRGRQKMDQR